MLKIYCYAEWDSEDARLIVGFMNAANHQSDSTVFAYILTEGKQSFNDYMTQVNNEIRKKHIRVDLLNQDNDHWQYYLNGDLTLQFSKLKNVIERL